MKWGVHLDETGRLAFSWGEEINETRANSSLRQTWRRNENKCDWQNKKRRRRKIKKRKEKKRKEKERRSRDPMGGGSDVCAALPTAPPLLFKHSLSLSPFSSLLSPPHTHTHTPKRMGMKEEMEWEKERGGIEFIRTLRNEASPIDVNAKSIVFARPTKKRNNTHEGGKRGKMVEKKAHYLLNSGNWRREPLTKRMPNFDF